MRLSTLLAVKSGSRIKLSDREADSTPGFPSAARMGKHDSPKDLGEEQLEELREKLAGLQYRLWAERRRSVLLVLQGMDTSGKDGVVRHVITGMNPSGCRVVSFKKPSEEENGHDFLWRIHRQSPTRGEIVVFNRSHYEDVLVTRVRGLVPDEVWKARYGQINEFEELLSESGTTIVKCYLQISKKEQKERLLARLADPEKNWKFDPQDVEERKCWGEYTKAYEEALARCSTRVAPWLIVPADKKWYRNWAIARVLVEVMEKMDPRPPKGKFRARDFEF
jgi:PPK2 family polyphosphate:nucleotide phosphotransferase